MANTTVRLKDYTSKKTGEAHALVIIQHKTKQYPISIPNIKIDPRYFSQIYGNWLTKSYKNKIGEKRIKTKINTEIELFKNEVHRVLMIAVKRMDKEKEFKISSTTIKNLLYKSEDEIMGLDISEYDEFYNKDFITEYKKFIVTYRNKNTRKNLFQSVAHLFEFEKHLKRKLKIKDFNSQLLIDFTKFLLDEGIQKDGVKIGDYIHNSIYKIVFKNLNRFRNYLINEENKELPNLSDYKFEKLVEVTELEPLNPQALTKTELDALFYYNFKSDALNNAKLLILIEK